jgi:DNA mismatch repair protein MutS
MRDLENDQTLKCIKTFADRMRLMREKLAQADKLYHNYQKKRWFLHAVETYCAAVQALVACISLLEVSSSGLVLFRDYVIEYADSDRFGALLAAANKLTGDLTAVLDARPTVRIHSSKEAAGRRLSRRSCSGNHACQQAWELEQTA